MYAHKVPKFYLLKWANNQGKQSLFFFDKKRNSFNSEPKNADNVFGEGNYYYLRLFMDAPLNNTDGKISGSQMWMTGVLKDAFPYFFDYLDNNIFQYCTFYRAGNEITKDKSFEFVYSYFSAQIDRVKVIGKNGKEIKQVTVRKMIEDYWNSESFREIIEAKLSATESGLSDIHDEIIDGLNKENLIQINLLHNKVSHFCAIQQARIPENIVTKKAIDDVLAGMNQKIIEEGRLDLAIEYESYDYKDLCQVQLLKFFTGFKHSNLLMDKSLLKYDSLYEAYFNQYKDSTFFYMKATQSHKFVVGDDPMISISTSRGSLLIAFPISPEYCLLVLRTSGVVRKDVILPGNNNFIDYFNYAMLQSTSSGIVNVNKEFTSKIRVLDEMQLRKTFNKKNFTF